MHIESWSAPLQNSLLHPVLCLAGRAVILVRVIVKYVYSIERRVLEGLQS